MIADFLAIAAIVAGIGFFIAGTAGLLRFPDTLSRLHALTKADNLGLGFIAIGVGIELGDPWSAAKLVLVWLLAVLAAATVSQLVARTVLPKSGTENFPAKPR